MSKADMLSSIPAALNKGHGHLHCYESADFNNYYYNMTKREGLTKAQTKTSIVFLFFQ